MSDLLLRDFHNDLIKLKKKFHLTLIVFNLGFYFSIVLAVLAGFYEIFLVIGIALLIAVSSLFLLMFKANKIKNKIGDSRSKEIFRIIHILNLISFISILMNVILYFNIILRVIGGIVIVYKYYNNFQKLKKIYGTENLSEKIRIPSMIVLFGMILSGIYIGNLIGTIIISFVMFLIYRETFQFTNQGDFLNITKSLTHAKPIQQSLETSFEKTEIIIKEEISQPITETMAQKAEVKPELIINPEITIKEEIPKQHFETTVLKAETKPEIVIQPKLISEVEINQRKISEKPIQRKIIIKEIKPLVSKKKCPFCGKEHDDLNTPFCHACGYKF